MVENPNQKSIPMPDMFPSKPENVTRGDSKRESVRVQSGDVSPRDATVAGCCKYKVRRLVENTGSPPKREGCK